MNSRVLLLLVLLIALFWVNGNDAQRKKSSGKKGKKDPCHSKEIEVCINKVQALSKRKEPSVLIASNDGLNTICKAIREDLVKCVKTFVKKCGTPLHKEISDLVIDQISLSTKRFCDESNPDRATFLKHSPCIHKKVLSQESYKSTCNNNFLAAVDQIDSNERQDAKHADKTYSTICCGYNQWDSCAKNLVVKECGKDAHDIFSEFVGEAFGTLAKMICPRKLFAEKKDICHNVLPAPTKKPIGKIGDNALTKYVVSLFSFLFVFED